MLNSDAVLSPVVPVHPYVRVSSTQRRLSGFPAQIQCHAGSTPTPVGRIIYDMLSCSASNENESSRSWLKVCPSSVESIPTPVMNPSSSLQLPTLAPTISASLPNSIDLASTSTTNSKYTSLNTTPPSPSLFESYARTRPGEVEILEVTQLDVAVGPSLSVSEASPSNSNGQSISSTTTIASVTDSAISTATATTSVFLDEASEVEEPRKTVNDGDMWINDDPVVGSPVNDVDVQPMSKAEGSGPFMTLRLFSADDLEELDGLDGETQLMDTTTTTAAALTKKKTGIRKKVKTKTKPLRRNSLKSASSTLSPPLPALHQSTSSSLTNQKQIKGSSNGEIVGGGSIIRRASSRGDPEGGGVGGTGKNDENEVERGRERMIAMEIIQMQRRQQLLIQQQQQQQLEMKQREDEQRSLIAQLARQDAEIRKRRQRVHHEQRQEQGMQREENGLFDVSSKRPVMFNIEHSNPDPNTNTKHSTHETLNMVSSALAAKVKQTLADPLLPGQHKGMTVLTKSDSEFEHSDDDGSWSSEEMGSEDEEVSFLYLTFFFTICMGPNFFLFYYY
jgi:hypothetical protein